MILWAFKPHTVETKPAWPNAPLRSWRWTIDIRRWSVGIIGQVHGLSGNEWRGWVGYYLLVISTWWHIGVDHTYYDGPHCSLNLGFLHFQWQGKWCKRCMPDDDCEDDDAVEAVK